MYQQSFRGRDRLRAADVARRARRYGLTPKQYHARMKAASRCRICKHDFKQFQRTLDHDHDTGRARGVLCHRCNSALGLFGDKASVMKVAVAYIEHYRDRDRG